MSGSKSTTFVSTCTGNKSVSANPLDFPFMIVPGVIFFLLIFAFNTAPEPNLDTIDMVGSLEKLDPPFTIVIFEIVPTLTFASNVVVF